MSHLEGIWEIETNSGEILCLQYPKSGIRGLSGYGLVGASHVTQKAPGQHGDSHLGYALEPRVLQASLAWKGIARSGRYCVYERRKQHIYPSLNYLDNPLKVRRYLQTGELRELWDVWYVDGLELDSGSGDGRVQTGAVQLVAHDPVWYDPDADSHASTLADSDTGDELVFDTPAGVVGPTSIFGTVDYLTFGMSSINQSLTSGEITTDGDWYTFPTIVVTGPAVGFEIENLISGHQITLDYSIAAAEVVTFDLRYAYKTVTNAVGDNLAGYVPPTDDLADFCLWPDPLATDGENDMRIFCGDATPATSVVVSWYDRYLGI